METTETCPLAALSDLLMVGSKWWAVRLILLLGYCRAVIWRTWRTWLKPQCSFTPSR